jgi:NAD(P)-dependent dehydrogenase (short-subunit alcohol dehydrogenase family)
MLTSKVALITGGARGIGACIARTMAGQGARVALLDLDGAEAEKTAAGLPTPGMAVTCDVALETDVAAAVQAVVERFGGLDVLVNNAGGAPEPHYPEAPTDHWMRMLDVNLRAVMLATQLALEPMRRRGGGAVVNVASVAALGYEAYVAPEYAAAKAAVVRLTSSLASLAERDNVRVTCICPDWVATDAVLESFAQATAAERKDIPPLVPVEETAEEILQLATDESLSGRVLVHWAGGPKYVVPTDLQSRSWRGTEESS